MATKASQGFADAPTPVKVLLGVLIVLVLTAAYYAVLHMSLGEELEAAEVKQNSLQAEKAAAEQQKAEYLKLRNELRDRESIDRVNKRVLPESAEIPAVLQDINRLAEVSGIQIKTVHPRPEQKEELYVRIPLSLVVKGRFHQIARFIYSTSRLERVVNMENVSLKEPKLEGDDVVLAIEVRATTFRRPTVAAEGAAAPAAKGKKGGKKK
jgi:type IV pilus assembly protein PilO